MGREMTAKQRVAAEALQAARAAGVGLTEYARSRGLNARQVHDAVAALRRRGALPPTDRPRPGKARFIPVRVADAPPSAPRTGLMCRVIHPDGLMIECGQWPPATWLLSLLAGRRDAAA
jgi:hypothetical protein